jgi:ATP-dependent Clp protease protease subunit
MNANLTQSSGAGVRLELDELQSRIIQAARQTTERQATEAHQNPNTNDGFARSVPSRSSFRAPIMNRPGIPLLARGKSETPRQWFSVKNESNSEHAEICLYDEIGEDWFGEGDSAKSFSEALDKIPKGRKILVRINSPGGNVYDGIAMYKRLRERKDDVTTQIDGIALSIASVVALGGSKVIIARTGQLMAHDPWTAIFVQGTAEDIAKESRLAMDALNAAKKSIVVAYVDRTGKTEDDVKALMSATTWYVGGEAKTAGFVDEVSNDEAVSNNFDLSGFKRVPEAFRKLNNSAAQNSGHTTTAAIMDKKKLVALLKKHGATVDDNATIEQLEAQLEAVLSARANQQSATTPATGATTQTTAETNRIAALEARYESERKARITERVDALIQDRRVLASERDFLITEAMREERHLMNAAARPQLPLPEAGIVQCVSESIHDVAAHAKVLGGHSAAPRNALALTSFLRQHNKKIVEIWNTNTIDSTLKQDVLMDEGLRAFGKLMNNLSAFSTKFDNVPLRGTNVVAVPFYNLQSAASTDWVAANGYVAGNTAVSKSSVTINKRKYQALSFTSDELRRQPFLGLQQNMVLNAEKLAYDIQQDIFSLITLANYGAAAYTGVPSTFDSSVVANLQLAATTAQWPFVGRSLFVNSNYDNNLKKDTALKLFFNSGSTQVLVDGRWTSKLYGFDYYEAPNLPANAQNLAGFIAFKSAIIIATAPIEPAEEVIRDGTQYSIAADPNGGPSLEMRKIGDSQKDTATWVIESNYGYNIGNASALLRAVTA